MSLRLISNIRPSNYYGPYISSSRTTRKRHKQTSSRSAGGTRTSRTMGRGVAESHNVTGPVWNVGIWERGNATYRRTNIPTYLVYFIGVGLYI
jgi:hypothetical protein